MQDYIDAYCERTGPGLFSEPLNAVTNFSFIIAAWAAWSLARRARRLSPGVWGLITMAVVVGVGSMLWHTFATNWALWLDLVPILVFIIWFIWLYARSAGMSPSIALAWVGIFVMATLFTQGFTHILHGALVYAPGLIILLALGVVHAHQPGAERSLLLGAGGVYLAALAFRTIDNEICSALPIGTHFLWHSLIGLVVYLAMRAVILSPRSRVGLTA